MDLSFALPTSGSWATHQNVTELAQLADARGCRGLWTFQRVLHPDGSGMTAVYHSVLDPMVVLGYAAAVTTRARLGLAVVNGPFYAPAVLAKQLTAIDVLSGGRLDAGIGLGWLPAEFETAGVSMEHRGKRFNEWLDCLDVLLTREHVSFNGDYYTVPSSQVLPRPIQQPRPPILIGGSSDAAYRRVARRGDGWIASSRLSIPEIATAVSRVRQEAERAGKDPASMHCVVRGVTWVREGHPDSPERTPLHGTTSQIASDAARYAEVGVDELFFDLNFD